MAQIEMTTGGGWNLSAAARPAVYRWVRLIAGLAVFAIGIALTVRAGLGLSPWDVLHDAVRAHTPLTFGQVVVAVSAAVVAGSLVLGVKPGPGTIANMLLVGAFTDGFLGLGLLGDLASSAMPGRLAALLGGVAAMALGSALYIGAELGAGPRDSLMLGIAQRSRVSAGAARAAIELSVLALGAALGGALGVGTAVFAILIGPAINGAFRMFGMESRTEGERGVVVGRARNHLARWSRRGRLGASRSVEMARYTGARR